MHQGSRVEKSKLIQTKIQSSITTYFQNNIINESSSWPMRHSRATELTDKLLLLKNSTP
jgi:hypothetical protein